MWNDLNIGWNDLTMKQNDRNSLLFIVIWETLSQGCFCFLLK